MTDPVAEIVRRWRELAEDKQPGLPSYYRVVERESIVKLLAWIDQQAMHNTFLGS